MGKHETHSTNYRKLRAWAKQTTRKNAAEMRCFRGVSSSVSGKTPIILLIANFLVGDRGKKQYS